jgi:hypothetical protein
MAPSDQDMVQNCLLKYKHLIKLACERENNTNQGCTIQVKHATCDRCQKLKTHLGGVLPRGCPLMRGMTWGHMLSSKCKCHTTNHKHYDTHDKSFRKPMHLVSHS